MRETEAEVLARIERTRARMGETIDEIGDRVNPDRVQAEIKARAREQVREVKATMKYKARSAMRDIEHEVSDAGRGLWDTIRENPIPAGMVGVGLAWLVANGATGRDYDYEYDDLGYRYPRNRPVGYRAAGSVGATGPYAEGEYAYDVDRTRAGAQSSYATGGYVAVDSEAEGKGRVDEVKEKASEAKDRFREKAHDAADEVRDRASHLKHRASEEMHEMQDRASHAARQAANRARRAERRVEYAVQDNPLAAGAIAAALGFAAGMMIPESHREQEMFGRARDKMVDKAERTVRRAGQKAREVAKETASVAKETASEGARQAVDEMTSGSRERAGVSEPVR